MPKPHGNMKKKEKARDFKGTVSKLLSYTRPYYFKVIFVLVLTVVSTLLSIIAPKVTGNATTLLFEGIVSKYTGGAGIDFSGIFNILVTLTVILIGSFQMIFHIISEKISQKRLTVCHLSILIPSLMVIFFHV